MIAPFATTTAQFHYLPIYKIIEKLIHTLLAMFLSKSNTLYERQFGFQPNQSTTHALLEIAEKIVGNKGKGRISKRCFRKTTLAKFFGKRAILTP